MIVRDNVRLIECPRDAMQGWKKIIPTAQKIRYIQSLLALGFDTIDAGSFVSAKAIPQMADTAEVLRGLDTGNSKSRILCIVANERGALEGASMDEVNQLGFPFSISETFQQRNTNSGIEESFIRLQRIQEICTGKNKELVVYISMGFGNPYNDPYSTELVYQWAEKIKGQGVNIISVADTVGLATAGQVYEVTSALIRNTPGVDIGVHLHSSPFNWQDKLEAAIKAGSRRIDGALKGIGGCPMAGDELVGNMDTELMLRYLADKGLVREPDPDALSKCLSLAGELFAR